MKVYFITGAAAVSNFFRYSSTSLVSEQWMLLILKNVAGYADADIAKLTEDESGIARVPHPGTESIAPGKRIWHLKHDIHNDCLASPKQTEALASSFQHFFGQALDAFSVGEWAEVSIFDFMRHDMAAAAVCSVVGRRILDRNPGFVDMLWQYDSYAESLAFGLPSWLNKQGIKVREDFRAMCLKWYEEANEESDEALGSQFSRELGRWAKSFGFAKESMAGVYAFLFLGLNTNTIPVCTWALMEVIKDPDLFQATREEVSRALVVYPTTGKRMLDTQKLASLPLIQSIYTESLRLHMSLNVTRTAKEDFTVAGFTLPKGCTIQAPTQISHCEEAVWGTPDHPASEFWAHRHVKTSGTTDAKRGEFSMAGRTGSFFPYGGGGYMCPGRNFAKQEILLAIAIVVTRFDVELVEWTELDGSPSTRPAQNDPRYAGAGSVPPDREMKARWRRLW
ncbi:cytochrome P450 [Hypoxylon crocopeplum]|nr:cytochrome P450 [Hypoxylon crocopeplum]